LKRWRRGGRRVVGERMTFQRDKKILFACEQKFYRFRHVISVSSVNTAKITLINTINLLETDFFLMLAHPVFKM
jgi:hypothetical protein